MVECMQALFRCILTETVDAGRAAGMGRTGASVGWIILTTGRMEGQACSQ